MVNEEVSQEPDADGACRGRRRESGSREHELDHGVLLDCLGGGADAAPDDVDEALLRLDVRSPDRGEVRRRLAPARARVRRGEAIHELEDPPMLLA
jgi:hypothetical protein